MDTVVMDDPDADVRPLSARQMLWSLLDTALEHGGAWITLWPDMHGGDLAADLLSWVASRSDEVTAVEVATERDGGVQRTIRVHRTRAEFLFATAIWPTEMPQ